MRVSSASQASYVDLRDGFTNLPFLTDQFLATSIAELKGEDISTVLHEFTHQLSLASPLGLIFAYHIALDLANKAYMAYLAKLLGRDTGKTDKAAAATLEIYVDEYSESIRTFNNAVQTLRWLFEGIAMFAELNYASSKKYPIASKHWNLLMVLLNGIQQELPKDEPTNEELIRQVEDLLASSSLEQHRAAMRKSLFFDEDLRTAPYFAGYLLIKGLQKRLSQKDERLSDPEVLLVFLLGSFFNNRFLLGLVPLSGNASFEFRENYIKQKLMTYVQGSLRRILDADPSTLKKAVDRIVNHSEFTTNYFKIDHQAILVGEEPQDLPLEKIVEMFTQAISSHCERIKDLILSEQSRLPDAEEYVETLAKAALNVFDRLRLLHHFFKLVKTNRLLLGYKSEGEWVKLISIFRVNLLSTQLVKRDDFALLLRQIETEGLHVCDLSQTHQQVLAEDGTNYEALADLINEVQAAHRKCYIREYEVYDLVADERVEISIRRDFYQSVNKTITSRGLGDMPVQNEAALKFVAPYLRRNAHKELFNLFLPSDFSTEAWNDALPGTKEDILEAAWRMVFPKAVADREELERFWGQKLNVVDHHDLYRSLFDHLCKKEISADLTAVTERVKQINQSWMKYVDSPLIFVIEIEPGTLELRSACCDHQSLSMERDASS